MKEKIIVLDPGHGGRDPGAVFKGIKEKDLNLKIAARLYLLLKSQVRKVKMTRTNDRYLSLKKRVKVANKYKANIFISIHCNAAASKKVNGIETLYYPGSIKGKSLAKEIQLSLIEKLKRRDREIKERADLFVLKYTIMPAVLIECGFMSSPEERELLSNEKYKEDIATAILGGVKNYFEKV